MLKALAFSTLDAQLKTKAEMQAIAIVAKNQIKIKTLVSLLLSSLEIVQSNLAIRNPRYKEQLGYKELFSDFFFYVMGFLDIRNKFGIFPKWKNLDIRNDFQGKCNHFDQYFTETPLRVLFVMICNSCVCCFW